MKAKTKVTKATKITTDDIIPLAAVLLVDLAIGISVLNRTEVCDRVNSNWISTIFFGGALAAITALVMFIQSLVKKRFKFAAVNFVILAVTVYALLLAFGLAIGAGLCDLQF